MANPDLMRIDDQTLANIMNNKRRSAKCNFKNPPQPKFCIKSSTLDGHEVFINVLSYSRIANQISEFDPIPLYFGMQIRSYSSIKNTAYTQQSPSPQLIFAVMASPEVLKNFGRGRSCVDSAEQMNLCELMCEFVEAMNPGILLSKKPEILKDRDLAGELKDVWSAVQSFRDKEKAGASDIVVYTEFGPADSSLDSNGKPVLRNDMSKSPNQSEPCHANDDIAHHSDCLEKENGKEDGSAENIGKSFDESDSHDIEIDQLSLLDKKSDTKQHEQDNEKIVKIQNQKNKESQHTFFPKFLSSSKDREPKDKEKEKLEKQDEEPKGKKKSLNFFRRNKSSSSPTHTNNNNSKNNQKSDSNADH